MLYTDIIHAVSPILFSVLFMLIHLLFANVYPSMGYFRTVKIAFSFSFFLQIGFESLFVIQSLNQLLDSISIVIVNITIYCFIGLGYFSFINLAVSALRIRLLTELFNRPDGLTNAELFKKYNANEIVHRRIAKLGHNGQIINIDNRYHVQKSITLYMVIILEFLRVIILGNKIRIPISEIIHYIPPNIPNPRDHDN